VLTRWLNYIREHRSDYAFLLLIAGTVVTLDQWTKWLVRTNLPNAGDMWSPWPWLSPYARIVHWTNTGAAFGLFQNLNDVFMVLAIIVSFAILFYFPQVPRSEWPLRIAMGLQMGGAVGNLIDRLAIGHVVDFISVGNFAVFNIADASISTGVAVLLIGFWYKETLQKKDSAKTQVEAESPPSADPPPKETHIE
jgi:signal peptidase II